MTSSIYIVRHGQDEDNAKGLLNGRRDKPLTTLGSNQASEVADKLVDHNIVSIWSSPLKRATQTANIIASRLGVDKVVIEPELIERNFGIMTGKPVTDISKISTNNIQGDKILYFIDPEGAELFPDLLTRAQKVLDKVQSLHLDGNILLVAHGDIGEMIRAAYHNWSWKDALMTPYLDNTGVIELKPGNDKIE